MNEVNIKIRGYPSNKTSSLYNHYRRFKWTTIYVLSEKNSSLVVLNRDSLDFIFAKTLKGENENEVFDLMDDYILKNYGLDKDNNWVE